MRVIWSLILAKLSVVVIIRYAVKSILVVIVQLLQRRVRCLSNIWDRNDWSRQGSGVVDRQVCDELLWMLKDVDAGRRRFFLKALPHVCFHLVFGSCLLGDNFVLLLQVLPLLKWLSGQGVFTIRVLRLFWANVSFLVFWNPYWLELAFIAV